MRPQATISKIPFSAVCISKNKPVKQKILMSRESQRTLPQLPIKNLFRGWTHPLAYTCCCTPNCCRGRPNSSTLFGYTCSLGDLFSKVGTVRNSTELVSLGWNAWGWKNSSFPSIPQQEGVLGPNVRAWLEGQGQNSHGAGCLAQLLQEQCILHHHTHPAHTRLHYWLPWDKWRDRKHSFTSS